MNKKRVVVVCPGRGSYTAETSGYIKIKNKLIKNRIDLIDQSTEHLKNVNVSTTKSLIVNFARENNSVALIRGLRSISDFEYEFQMALMNRSLAPEISTLFMMPDEKYMHLNSTVVKEIAALGGDISTYVPEVVNAALKSKLSK